MYVMSSQGWRYSGCFSRSWSRKRPLRQPKAISSLHSSREKAPHDRIMSTNDTAMQPSTLRIRFARFLVVICSVSRAKSRIVVDLKCFLAYSLMSTTRWSGFARDLIRWPMPITSRFSFLHLSINALGLMPLS